MLHAAPRVSIYSVKYLFQFLIVLFVLGFIQEYIQQIWQMKTYIAVLKQRPVCDEMMDIYDYEEHHGWFATLRTYVQGRNNMNEECREYLKHISCVWPKVVPVLINYISGLSFMWMDVLGEHIGTAIHHITKHHSVWIQLLFACIVVLFLIVFLFIACNYTWFTYTLNRMRTAVTTKNNMNTKNIKRLKQI
jgi:hypothetical protein